MDDGWTLDLWDEGPQTERDHSRTARVHARTERVHARTERVHARTERVHASTEMVHLCFKEPSQMLGPTAGLKEGSEVLIGPHFSSSSRSGECLLPTEE